ncbi:O-antigen ligase family protein [bacterium]|nr:O-antigen ligase family protein [bacterium]
MLNINFTKKRITIFLLLIALTAGYISTFAVYQKFYGFEATEEFVGKFQKAEDRILQDAKKRLETGRVYSTFSLPSTLAGYLGMVIPILILLSLISDLSIMRITALIFLVSSCTALFFTKSFGGILSTIVSFLIFGFLFAIKRFHISGPKLLLLLIIILLLSSSIFFIIGQYRPDAPWNFSHPDNPMFQRFKNFKSAIGIIHDFPLTGAGPGTFGAIYPKYAPPESNQSQHVHNSYLEFGAETGIFGLMIFSIFAIYWLYKAGKTIHQEKDNITLKEKLLFSIAGSVFLLHNLTDFDFYSPGLSTFAFAVLALPFISERKIEPLENKTTNNNFFAILSFVMIALIIYCFSSLVQYQASKYFGIEDRILWKNRLKDTNSIMEDLQRAAKLEPDNPIYYVYMAKVHEYKASNMPGYTKFIELKEAIKCYDKIIALEPYVADSYAQAGKLALMNNEPVKAVNYLKMAVKNNPNFEPYQVMLKSAEIMAKEVKSKIEKLDKSKLIKISKE